MTDAPLPIDIERRRLGEHADDVLYLRSCGLTVAPFHGGFRVNGEVVGEDGLRKRAELERDKRAGRAFQQALQKKFQTAEIVEGAKVVAEPTAGVTQPRTNAPEIEAGLAGEADAPATPDIGDRPRIVWLSLELLSIDRRYQRDVGERGLAHINRIAREFHWSKYQPIVVNERADGTYAVIDGQHRLEGARKNPLVTELPCYVVAVPDLAAEASIFASVNTQRLGLTPHQKFWAAKASDDETAVAAFEIAERHGVKILRTNPPHGVIPPLCVNSPASLRRAITLFGKAALATAVGLIAETHPETPNAFRSAVIMALSSMAVSKGFGRERMKRTMKGLDLDKLYEDARLDRITEKGTLETATERVLRKAYEASA